MTMTGKAGAYAGDGSYPGSYYAASVNAVRTPMVLAGEATADICIVGAGYTGLSTAIHLAEKGYDVTLVEGARVGWGASGRNGGQVVNGLNAGLDDIVRRYGSKTGAFFGSLLQEGAGIIYRLVDQYGIECDLKHGNVYAAYTTRHMRGLEAKQALWRQHGMDDHELLDREAIRRHVGSDLYAGGMMDRSGGHMHPLNLALGEARAFESLGGRIYELSPVTGIERPARRTAERSGGGAGGATVVRTSAGAVTAKTVVLCGNAYLGRAVPELAARVMPVSTQMIATEPLGSERAASLLPTDMCLEDSRYILDYFRLSADRRLIFGGGVVYGGTGPADVVAKIRPNMEKVFPSLRGIGIDYAWSGNFALSFTRVPQLGRLGD
ncbi:MAG: FAD-binding oxidoreductase, partial [Proteobacteria bacterium]|nr:FAD-binding oxidoreductase [Pseudomonadota bacterium]